MVKRNNNSVRIRRSSIAWATFPVLGAFFLAGCDSLGGGVGTQYNAEPAPTELNLFNSRTFNTQLVSSLDTRAPVVTVKVVAPFTANNIPESMDKWLDSVGKYDGKVELKPDPDYPRKRGFLSTLQLLIKAYDLSQDIWMYRKAENYNVDVLYKPGSGEVTKFVFTRKDRVQ